MGFHTFTAGEVLTAANVNNYLMNQAVIVATSGTRPASPVNGMLIYETDTQRFQIYNGTAWVQHGGLGAWATYSPGMSAGSTPTLSGNSGRYMQFGKTVMATGNIGASGSATSGTVTSNLPIAPFSGSNTTMPIGTFGYYIGSSNTVRFGGVFWTGTGTTIHFALDNQNLGTQFQTAIAASDNLSFSVTYETA